MSIIIWICVGNPLYKSDNTLKASIWRIYWHGLQQHLPFRGHYGIIYLPHSLRIASESNEVSFKKRYISALWMTYLSIFSGTGPSHLIPSKRIWLMKWKQFFWSPPCLYAQLLALLPASVEPLQKCPRKEEHSVASVRVLTKSWVQKASAASVEWREEGERWDGEARWFYIFLPNFNNAAFPPSRDLCLNCLSCFRTRHVSYLRLDLTNGADISFNLMYFSPSPVDTHIQTFCMCALGFHAYSSRGEWLQET
jgi:hypothetical protein